MAESGGTRQYSIQANLTPMQIVVGPAIVGAYLTGHSGGILVFKIKV